MNYPTNSGEKMSVPPITFIQKLMVSTCLALFCSTAFAADDTLETSTNGFDIAYSTSFLMFDACGESDMGKWYREVVIAQVESCPLTPDAKQHFYKLALRNASNTASNALKLVASHASLPSPNDIKCNKSHSPEFQALREKLSQYHSGKISLSEVTWSSCKEGSEEGGL